jgi:hypothetical protein
MHVNKKSKLLEAWKVISPAGRGSVPSWQPLASSGRPLAVAGIVLSGRSDWQYFPVSFQKNPALDMYLYALASSSHVWTATGYVHVDFNQLIVALDSDCENSSG